ncbi:Mu transposase C-terminal domain-containing protein [Zavarzinia sp.]|uniref:Mu transposase C-terminal domain-containing protein n=1 Tax=Zavarzinia sp. TaxID=2027920 RepID=UPI003BB5084F
MRPGQVTIGHIAEALNLSKRAAEIRAQAGWPYVERVLPSGGRRRLYAVTDLPREVQDALSRHQLELVRADLRAKGVIKDEAAAPAPAAIVAAEKVAQGTKADARRDGRIEVYQAYIAYRLAAGASDRQAMPSFAALYVMAAQATKAGVIANGLPEAISSLHKWVFEAQPRLSVATLRRIAEAVKKGEIGALSGRYGGRKDTGVLDRAFGGRAVEVILALLSKSDHLSAGAIRTQLRGNLGEEAILPDGEVVPWPSERRIQDWVSKAKVKFADVLMSMKNPDAWRSRYEFAFGEQAVGEGLNDIWQIDASPADVLLVDGRHSIYVLVDLWSRRIMALVTRTPRAAAVVALQRRGMLEWGGPRKVKTDNGSDFVATRVKGVMLALKIVYEQSRAFSPTEKGHVERHVGTVQHMFMPLQPGFIGHDVTDQQAIRSRRAFADRLGETDADAFCVELTGEELQRRLDAWCVNDYAQRPHAGLDGQSPAERARSYAGEIRRIADPRALDLLLMDLPSNGGYRTVTKKGVAAEKASFWGPGLVVGDRVRVRLDPTDMGRIYVYTADDDAFICVAENPERLGISRAAVAAKAKADQRAETGRLRKQLKSVARRLRPLHEVAAEMARDALPPVLEFPRSTEAYTTPALQAAAEAAGSERPMPVAPAPEGPRAPAQIITLGKSPSALEAEKEAKAARLARWKGLDARIKGGETLSVDDAHWHAAYGQHAEVRAVLNIEKWRAKAGSRPA